MNIMTDRHRPPPSRVDRTVDRDITLKSGRRLTLTVTLTGTWRWERGGAHLDDAEVVIEDYGDSVTPSEQWEANVIAGSRMEDWIEQL